MERYQGLNRTTPHGLRTHVILTRMLRSFIEGGLLDLVNMNKFEPVLLEGDDRHGSDNVIEAHVTINDQDFIFHIEDQDDLTKPRGLLGVSHEQTAATVKESIDQTTWARIEAFIRFASGRALPHA